MRWLILTVLLLLGTAMAEEPATALWDALPLQQLTKANRDGWSRALNEAYLAALPQRLPAAEAWLHLERQRTSDNIHHVSGAAPLPVAGSRFITAYAAEQVFFAQTPARYPAELPNTQERAGWELPDRHVVLSFDDGPQGDPTRQILETLHRAHAPADFFLIGRKLHADQVPDYSGLQTGVHTWNHPALSEQTPDTVRSQLSNTVDAMVACGLPKPTLFRPPYGDRTPRELKIALDLGLRSVVWNMDSDDWQPIMQGRPERLERRIVALCLLRRRGVVLCHDPLATTAAMLPDLIETLRRIGFQLVAEE